MKWAVPLNGQEAGVFLVKILLFSYTYISLFPLYLSQMLCIPVKPFLSMYIVSQCKDKYVHTVFKYVTAYICMYIRVHSVYTTIICICNYIYMYRQYFTFTCQAFINNILSFCSKAPEEKINFEMQMSLSSTESWVMAPKHLVLWNGGTYVHAYTKQKPVSIASN